MRLNVKALTPVALFLSLALCAPARAGSDWSRVREAGPEDGFLCCTANLTQFLFHDDKVSVATGRAGIFRSDHRGERWERRMNGVVGPDGASGYVDFVCQAPSDGRTLYALVFTFSFGEFLFSTRDFGSTWTRRAAVAVNSGFPTCIVDPGDRDLIYIVDNLLPPVLKSADGGRSVQAVDNLPSCYSGDDVRFNLDVLSRLGILYVDGGLNCKFALIDGGRSFFAVLEPSAFGVLLSVSPDGHTLFFKAFDSN